MARQPRSRVMSVGEFLLEGDLVAHLSTFSSCSCPPFWEPPVSQQITRHSPARTHTSPAYAGALQMLPLAHEFADDSHSPSEREHTPGSSSSRRDYVNRVASISQRRGSTRRAKRRSRNGPRVESHGRVHILHPVICKQHKDHSTDNVSGRVFCLGQDINYFRHFRTITSLSFPCTHGHIDPTL